MPISTCRGCASPPWRRSRPSSHCSPRASWRSAWCNGSWPRWCHLAGSPASTSAKEFLATRAPWWSCRCSSGAWKRSSSTWPTWRCERSRFPATMRSWPQRWRASGTSTAATRPPETTVSFSSTAIASGIRDRASSWAGSASGGRSSNSIDCCAPLPRALSLSRSGTCRSCPPCAMSSPSMPTRDCRGTPRGP